MAFRNHFLSVPPVVCGSQEGITSVPTLQKEIPHQHLEMMEKSESGGIQQTEIQAMTLLLTRAEERGQVT